MRRVLHFAVWVVIGLSLVRLWWLEPSIVATGSMFPTLVGDHVKLKCGDCGILFACDAQRADHSVACPNCGYRIGDTEGFATIDGDRFLINKAAFLVRDPRRWEVIAFRCPDQPRQICIKRVVGLPGETIDIRHGDVYVDGQPVRKTLTEQRAVAVPVHDANFPPHGSETSFSRWYADAGATHWQSARRDGIARFYHPATAVDADAPAAPIDWLSYHHRARGGDSSDVGSVAAAVTDRLAYNRDTMRRPFLTSDLSWTCRLRAGGSGLVWFRAGVAGDEFLVRCDLSRRRAELLHNGQSVQQVELDSVSLTGGASVCLSLVDRQFLFAVDGRPWFRPRPRISKPATEGESAIHVASGMRPFSVSAQGAELELSDLQVLRDVYYTPGPAHLPNQPGRTSVKLAADEFFVLGDNSAVAADSRSWSGTGAIGRKSLVGKPFVVDRPSRLMSIAGHRFQVPDLGKIRYIR